MWYHFRIVNGEHTDGSGPLGLVQDGSVCFRTGLCLRGECVNVSIINPHSCPIDENGNVCSGNGVSIFSSYFYSKYVFISIISMSFCIIRSKLCRQQYSMHFSRNIKYLVSNHMPHKNYLLSVSPFPKILFMERQVSELVTRCSLKMS